MESGLGRNELGWDEPGLANFKYCQCTAIDDSIDDRYYLIENAETEKQYTKNSETNREMLADYKVVISLAKTLKAQSDLGEPQEQN
jgi:hypothetical protein